MKTVREAHDKRIVRDAWAVWLQKHRAEAADRVYVHRLAAKFLARWKEQRAKVGVLENTVLRLGKKRDKGQLQRCWILWRRAVDLRRAEGIMAERVELRVLTNAFDAWKGRLLESQAADRVHDTFLMRRTLLSWKAARDRIQVSVMRCRISRTTADKSTALGPQGREARRTSERRACARGMACMESSRAWQTA